jgi:hypothetical protein
LGDIQVVTAESASDSTTPIKVADVICPSGMVAIGGGGAVEMAGSTNEDIGIDVSGPIGAISGLLGSGNTGWRAQATNFFINSDFNWSVIVFAICVPVQ